MGIGAPRNSWDHPRSRGVYCGASPSPAWAAGSSPLARGLPLCLPSCVYVWGIIPARAGFTRRVNPPMSGLTDHPRSRGVYSPRCAVSARRTGSSPLARGLRQIGERARTHVRIIPARAGFTLDPNQPICIPADHPRSRGVYFSLLSIHSLPHGSSPLARGLLGDRLPVCEPNRIIPARAGFTRGSPSRSLPSGDHPRSRGVYLLTAVVDSLPEGSSPLARGLRRKLRRVRARSRIIPARAGFTPGRDPGPGRGADHPRSRGVYLFPIRR